MVGPKKPGDVKLECLKVYSFLAENKYQNKISFEPVIANMFYAGPREAVHHLLLRHQSALIALHRRQRHGERKCLSPQIELVKKLKCKFTIKVMTHNCKFANDVKILLLVAARTLHKRW